jgi:hypothetical protein
MQWEPVESDDRSSPDPLTSGLIARKPTVDMVHKRCTASVYLVVTKSFSLCTTCLSHHNWDGALKLAGDLSWGSTSDSLRL